MIQVGKKKLITEFFFKILEYMSCFEAIPVPLKILPVCLLTSTTPYHLPSSYRHTIE